MTESDAALLERELPKLLRQRATGCCLTGGRIREIDSYLRQYVGVTVDGRQYIYINGFAAALLDDWPSQVDAPRWKTVAFIGCDGGSAFWGALYDPVTRKFSDLAINGSA